MSTVFLSLYQHEKYPDTSVQAVTQNPQLPESNVFEKYEKKQSVPTDSLIKNNNEVLRTVSPLIMQL